MAAPFQFDAPPTVGAQIEARARHREVGDRVFLCQNDRSWTYRQYRDESVRLAHFLLRRLGPIDERRPGHVAMLLENHLELLALYGACAYAGLTLFGVNTGLRGDTLSGVVEQSGARLLVVDERLLPEVERVADRLRGVPRENLLVLRTIGEADLRGRDLLECVASEVGPAGASLDEPPVKVEPTRNLMVIYTSGTTGLPKGINNNHLKFFLIGKGVSGNLSLGATTAATPACRCSTRTRCSWASTPPWSRARAWRCGSASAPASSCRTSSATGSPGGTTWASRSTTCSARSRQYGGDEARILEEVARHPGNRLRYAVGNGAAPPDIDRFTRWLGLEDMFELYGSTEAAISTFRRKGDPRGSVGEIQDPNVKILRSDGSECPPAELGPDGRILNYEEAVGEICRVASDTGLFQGYYGNRRPTPRSSGTASTTRETSGTSSSATGGASCTSTGAPTTGSARTARTSRRRRWGACCRSTRTWTWPPPTACPAPSPTSW
jgi:fatty-acyl-CoA synthase